MQPFSTESKMAPERLESRRQQHPQWWHYSVLSWCQIVLSSGQSLKSKETPKSTCWWPVSWAVKSLTFTIQFTALHFWRCSMRMSYESEGILVTSQWPISTTVKLETVTDLFFPNCESICSLFSCSTACQLKLSKQSLFFCHQISKGEKCHQKFLILIKISRLKNDN